jgi:thermitase
MSQKTTADACVARHVVFIAAIVAGNLTSAHAELAPSQQSSGETRFVKGRLLVQPRAGLKLRDLDDILSGHGGRRVDAIPQINLHIVQLPAQANDHAVAQALARSRHIKFAEVDRQVPLAYMPNDPGYANAWHLPKIGSPRAWDYSVGNGVTIAILDTGVDAAHPDLVNNLVSGYNTYDGNTDTRDVQGHGTRVAGTAAMAGNNSIGSAGVAFTSRIMPIRVTDLNGVGYISTLSKGITWAADRGARIASMSFNSVCGSSTLINAAQYMRSKGGVVVAAAGNSGIDEGQTASDAITCVSASDRDDVKASWSSYGAYVDVAAPGTAIYTTTNGGSYGSVSGTSFSAPMTAGVYALMMAANPQLAPSQLDTALFSSAVDLGGGGKDPYYGYGRIDAGAAVANVSTATPRDTTLPSVSIASPATGSLVRGLVAVDVTASDNTGVTRVDLYAGGSLVGSDSAAPYGFTWDTSGRPDGSVTLEARASDAAGNVGTGRVTVTVSNSSVGGTTPPGSTNVALASTGAVPSASSAYAGYPIAALNDNQRSGAGWGNGGGWNDGTAGAFPDWVQINFNGMKSIDRVVVYTVQDNYTNPVEPTDSMTFSLYGVVDFTVQGWNGSAWVTLASVTGSNLVKRTVSFAAFTTDRIRVHITKAFNSYSRITEIEAWGVAASSVPGPTNVALASVGAVPSASSAYAGYPVAALNDNQRSGAGWGNGGGWNDATAGAFPDWVQINFNGTKSTDRVIVYSVQDNYTNPVEPTDSMIFSLYGVVDFTVQGWNGSAWVALASVTGNNLIKRTVNFAAFTTDRIRVQITKALNSYSRITEIEAWAQ